MTEPTTEAEERFRRRHLARFGDDFGTPEWLARHPDLVKAARALAERGLAQAAARRDKPTDD